MISGVLLRTYLKVEVCIWMWDLQFIFQHAIILNKNPHGYFTCHRLLQLYSDRAFVRLFLNINSYLNSHTSDSVKISSLHQFLNGSYYVSWYDVSFFFSFEKFFPVFVCVPFTTKIFFFWLRSALKNYIYVMLFQLLCCSLSLLF